MNITTKFNIGDEVYTLTNDFQLVKGVVSSIKVDNDATKEENYSVCYIVNDTPNYYYYEENLCSSVEEIINRIKTHIWQPK